VHEPELQAPVAAATPHRRRRSGGSQPCCCCCLCGAKGIFVARDTLYWPPDTVLIHDTTLRARPTTSDVVIRRGHRGGIPVIWGRPGGMSWARWRCGLERRGTPLPSGNHRTDGTPATTRQSQRRRSGVGTSLPGRRPRVYNPVANEARLSSGGSQWRHPTSSH
jgi:hypothetical protein